MDRILNSPYLKKQIIPYIGNKRRLLPLILTAIKSISFYKHDRVNFLDIFSGSGVVSRLGKLLGFNVYSNDWEYYSYILNYAYLKVNKADLKNMYRYFGGMENVLNHLNSLPEPAEADEFIAKYYAPRDDSNPNYKIERLFYTRYNALIIDKIRNEIERLYPEDSSLPDDARREKYLLLALLIYNAATHSNTSGVFKAFHKGFGGFSKDALGRIMKKIELEMPVLVDGEGVYYVYKKDANALLKEDLQNNHFDIVYIDPPYNQHQYGSNYHILNSIALWDKDRLSVYLSKNPDKKAGIREDWVKTRSLYCYRETALKAFRDLIESIDARYILVSYNTEGIIDFDSLLDVLISAGKLRIFGNEYVKYRGGKQGLNRINSNIEFVLVVDRDRRSTCINILEVKYEILKKKYLLILKRKYSKEKLQKNFLCKEDSIIFKWNGMSFSLKTDNFYELQGDYLLDDIDRMGLDIQEKYNLLKHLVGVLQKSICSEITEEIEELLRLIDENTISKELVKRIPLVLKKIAHKKYKNIFYFYLYKIESLKVKNKSIFSLIEDDIQDIKRVSSMRFNG